MISKLIRKNRNRGFTLIEILVTIRIIGVLAGIGIISLGKIRPSKNQTTCINNQRGISQGLQMYYNDYMTFPDDGYPAEEETLDLIADTKAMTEAVRQHIEDTNVSLDLPVSDVIYGAFIDRRQLKSTYLVSSDIEWIYSQTAIPPSYNALIEVINSDDGITSSAYRGIIDAYTTLSDAILSAAISADIMSYSDNENALINKSPLSEPVLNTLVNTEGLMYSSVYLNVLLANSPGLPQSIINQLNA